MSDEKQAAKTLGKVLRFARRLSADVLFDIVALWFCWRDPRTPLWAKAVAAGALAYFVIPFDALPDPIFVDDAGVIALAMVRLRAVMLQDHREQARDWLSRFVGA
jgi:uncharacterized membrane protein YkvA (DUF1232 family)